MSYASFRVYAEIVCRVLSYTVTYHQVGFLNRRQSGVERHGWLRRKFCGSEVNGQRLRQSISDHQAMENSDSTSQQSGVGECTKSCDAAVHSPLNVAADARRPVLVQRQQWQHLSTDPVTGMT